MKIVVLVRPVVDCRVPLPPDLYGEKPLPEGMMNIINPADWFALEQGLSLCGQKDCNEVMVVSLGAGEAEDCLRWCLAAGAQQALRIWDEALVEADVLGKGRTLAAALIRLKPDLALCGDGCLDQFNTMLPGVAAAAADIPYVPGVTKLEKVEDGKAVVIRRIGKGKRERVLVRLPALVAIEDGGSASVFDAGLPDVMNAFTEPLPCKDLATLGLSAERYGSRGAKVHNIMVRVPIPMTVKPLTPDPRNPAEQRLRTILAGGMTRKKGEVVTGTPEQMADRIVHFLRDEPVITP